jgi:hypothetical protein
LSSLGATAAAPPLAEDRGRGPWEGVDRLIDRASRLEDLRRHGLQLLAGRRWRGLGRPIEAQLVHDEQLAAAVTLTAPVVLERARAAYDGRIMVMKGPEVAALYPSPQLRPYGDIDLLVDDAEAAQRALLDAGFRPIGDPSLYVDIHHLRPLLAPGLAVAVEVHDRPKWLGGQSAPATAELFSRAVPSATGVPGIVTLPPAEHALLIAAHSWAHVPFGRLSHLLDADLMAGGADESEIRALAERWGVVPLWHGTSAAGAALFRDGPATLPLRTWARGLRTARERTVLERHLETWLAPFSQTSPGRAAHTSLSAFVEGFRPQPGESWGVKLRRTLHALRSPSVRLSEHRRALADGERRSR